MFALLSIVFGFCRMSLHMKAETQCDVKKKVINGVVHRDVFCWRLQCALDLRTFKMLYLNEI